MKKKNFSVKTVALLAAAGLLLLGSAVGSTRAALTYYSENYGAEISVPSIGVTLVETARRFPAATTRATAGARAPERCFPVCLRRARSWRWGRPMKRL